MHVRRGLLQVQPLAVADGSRMAMGVNSFGAQGTNAHVLLRSAGAAKAVLHTAGTGVPAHRQRCWLLPPLQVCR